MNSLFGLELPAPVNFIVAFVVVLALIGAATWAVKRFGGARMEAASRGRQPRLAVVDSAQVDGRRRLVIVRRDNVEHLLMIGGPTDVVVEASIVRSGANAAARDPAARASAEPALPRVMPLPDPTPWPLAPEPAAASTPTISESPRTERPAERSREMQPQWPVVPDEPQVVTPAAVAPATRPAAVHTEPSIPMAAGDLSQARPEPVAPRPAARAAAAEPQPGDANLAEMAQRLEAALRRPMQPGEAAKPAAVRRIEPRVDLRAEVREVRAEVRVAPKPQARPASGAARATALQAAAMPDEAAAAQTKTEFENLEQEMASLLGRPSTGKT